MAKVDLKKLLKNKKTVLQAWVTFNEPFALLLEYTDRKAVNKILDKSKVREFNPSTHLRQEVMNDDKYAMNLTACIKDWRGLTVGKLAELTNVDISGMESTDNIPCTDDNKDALILEIMGLIKFVSETVMDVQQFKNDAAGPGQTPGTTKD